MRRLLITILITFCLLAAKAQQPSFEWAFQCGNPPNTTDTKTSLAINPQGGFYMAGDFTDQAQFGDKVLTSVGGTDIFLASISAEGHVIWSGRIGGADYDFLQKVITDDQGDIILAGYFYGTTQIGSDTYSSYGSQDIFIAKFNPAGEYIWSFRAGGPMADYISGISVDADRNIAVSGYFYGEIEFGDTTVLTTGSSDVFVAKFDADGNLLWVNSVGGTSSDQTRAVTCDPQGNILLSGSFYYNITLQDTTLTTQDPVGVFVASYLPDGQLNWVFQLNGTYLTPDVFITTDQNGAFFIAGDFSEEIVFGSKVFIAGEFNQDIYLAKYDLTGKLSWARHAFSASSDQAIGLAVDMYNNIYLTGHYLDTMHFNVLTLPYTLCCGSREIFIVSYSPDGDVLWGEKISGTRASIHSFGIDEEGEMFLSGLFTEELLLGDLTLSDWTGFRNYITGLHTEMFTAVPQVSRSSDILIYPNPSTGPVTIQTVQANDVLELSIFNVTGSRVFTKRVTDGTTLNLSNLPPGCYLLMVDNLSDGSRLTSRFIRQ